MRSFYKFGILTFLLLILTLVGLHRRVSHAENTI